MGSFWELETSILQLEICEATACAGEVVSLQQTGRACEGKDPNEIVGIILVPCPRIKLFMFGKNTQCSCSLTLRLVHNSYVDTHLRAGSRARDNATDVT